MPEKHQPLATRSRSVWLARKVITRRGAIGTTTPVLGLRPTRSFLSRSTKVPKPEIFTFSPLASAPQILSMMASISLADSARESPIRTFQFFGQVSPGQCIGIGLGHAIPHKSILSRTARPCEPSEINIQPIERFLQAIAGHK